MKTRGLRILDITHVCKYILSYAKNSCCAGIGWKLDTGGKQKEGAHHYQVREKVIPRQSSHERNASLENKM